MSDSDQPNLQELFLQAIEIPEVDRDLWLHEHCTDQATRNELAELLQFHDQNSLALDKGALPHSTHATVKRIGSKELHTTCPHCDKQIAVLADSLLTSITCLACKKTFSLVDGLAATENEGPSIKVGRFELLTQLGEGAFGSVWMANDPELERKVALKLPRNGRLSHVEAELFFREARTAAQLHHENIVPIHEVGRDGDAVFIVSELIRGTDLEDWLSTTQLRNREASQLCRTIALALHHAHEKGVIHRDLKPSNVMIDHDGKPYLMDFGLAKRHSQEAAMTIEGHPIGTPSYMSPEQAAGDSQGTDHRTDIYSLGVLLFRVLTGELPYRGNPNVQMQKRQTEDAPDPRKLNPQIPRDLATICLKSLERDASKRYDSAQEVADELTRFESGQPIHARPLGVIGRNWRLCKRNLAVSSLAVALFIVFFSSFGIVSWQLYSFTRAERARILAEVDNIGISTPASIQEKLKTLDLSEPIVIVAFKKLLSDEDGKKRLRAKLALAIANPSSVPGIQKDLLQLVEDPAEFVGLHLALSSLAENADEKLRHAIEDNQIAREVLSDDSLLPGHRLRAASMLRKGVEFDQQVEYIASHLLSHASANQQSLSDYIKMFTDSSPSLLESIENAFSDLSISERERSISAYFLAEYLKEDIPRLVRAAIHATPEQFAPLMNTIRQLRDSDACSYFQEINEQNQSGLDGSSGGLPDLQAARIANAAIGQVLLASPQAALSFLRFDADPSVQSHLIDRFSKLMTPPQLLLDFLKQTSDASSRYALLLALSNYPREKLQALGSSFENSITNFYLNDRDPGVHSASFLLLNRLRNRSTAPVTTFIQKKDPSLRWQQNSVGITMIEIAVPSGTEHRSSEERHRLLVAATEVTILQLAKFSEPWLPRTYKPDSLDCPAFRVCWSEAAKYCNWLSLQDGIPKSQWCYTEQGENNGLPLLIAKPNATRLQGYRLPTSSEWDFACAGGAKTVRHFGAGDTLISEYSWWGGNTIDGRVRPVATKKPNQFGFFDMYGNVIEWCHDTPPGRPNNRLLRGLGAGDFQPDPTEPFVPDIGVHGNEFIAGGIGFRVCRTLE